MNAPENYTSEAGQREMATGILKQAVQDLRRFHGATSAVERELYLDAHRWLMSYDYSWPFSFLNVCQLLNLAPETLREHLLGDLSLGPVSYWTRRCRRAARRFQTFLGHVFTSERNLTAVDPVPLTHVPTA